MKLIALIFACLFAGCANISVERTTTDPNGNVVTTKLNNSYFFAKSQIDRLVIDKTTKTTSQLIGADKAATAGDPETINAMNNLMAEVLVRALKSSAPIP